MSLTASIEDLVQTRKSMNRGVEKNQLLNTSKYLAGHVLSLEIENTWEILTRKVMKLFS